MPNTKAIGVAYADPQFDSVDVIGAVTANSVAAGTGAFTGTVTAPAVQASFTSTSSSGQLVGNANAGVYILSTAITAGVTTTNAPAGSLGLTTNATGVGKLFYSDGTNWQFPAIT
jgi:hypothetical protein